MLLTSARGWSRAGDALDAAGLRDLSVQAVQELPGRGFDRIDVGPPLVRREDAIRADGLDAVVGHLLGAALSAGGAR
jgi:hypothetical protein